jgi:hypothetical protein
MASKPSIVFVPGAWHGPESFDAVASLLTSAGYAYEGVTKPSSTLEPPFPTSIDADVEAIRTAVLKAADAGNDVVLVLHSYGGIPGSEASKGLSKEERAKDGKKGGIVRLVYVTAFAIPEGVSMRVAAGGEFAPWCQLDVRYIISIS